MNRRVAADEQRGLEALQAQAVLNSEPESALDRITRLAARVYRVPIAAIALRDELQLSIASSIGLSLDELPSDSALCGLDRGAGSLVVADARHDPRFADDPLVRGAARIRFFASTPLLSRTGRPLGMLCLMHPTPREFSAAEFATLVDLAAVVVDALELRSISRDLEQRSRELAEQTTVLRSVKLARERLEELARTDPLTGVANQRALRERLGALVAEAVRGRSFAAVMLDVDHFKRVNDNLGHPSGDELLRRVAKTLSSRVRSTDLVTRYGGEEFCIVLSDVDACAAAYVAEDLRQAIAALECPIPITASVGVCAYSSSASTVEQVIEGADRALYRAKREGRNRVVIEARESANEQNLTQALPA
jgi:diguanylate cyclase (GGDEF)-like protein